VIDAIPMSSGRVDIGYVRCYFGWIDVLLYVATKIPYSFSDKEETIERPKVTRRFGFAILLHFEVCYNSL
jgi:hypothetical protein